MWRGHPVEEWTQIAKHTGQKIAMLKYMRMRLAIWWKLRLLEGTYPPLLEQAKQEGNSERVLYIEEKFWFEKACLLEEQNAIVHRRKRLPRGVHPTTTPYHFRQTQQVPSDATPDLPSGAIPSADLWWIIPLSVLGGTLLGIGATHSFLTFLP